MLSEMRPVKLDNRAYFNAIAEKWDGMISHNEHKIRSILDMAGLRKGFRVLDAGTGTGILIPFLHSYVGNSGSVTAVDIAERMIEIARNKYGSENVRFAAGDVLEADLPEGYFDCVMCYSMFPHFEDKRAAVQKLARYLKKAGKLVICHSQSREAINNLHGGMSGPVRNDNLPPADVLKEYFDSAALEATSTVDNEEMFVIIGRKL